MNLYHWPHVDALKDWASGDLIVMAENLEQAKEVVAQDEEASPALKEEIRKSSEDDFRVYEKPRAIRIWGSA